MDYIPGFGDYAAKMLPELGANLNKIIRPEHEMEVEMRKLLMLRPELRDQMIEMERATPGSTGIYGKKAQQLFSNAEFTAPYQETKAQQKQQTTLNEQNIRKNETAIKAGDLEFLQSKELQDALDKSPTLKAYWIQKQTLGESQESFASKEHNAKEFMRRAPLVKPYEGMSSMELAREFAKNPSKFPGETMQALLEQRPDDFKVAFSLLDNEQRAALSVRLQGMQNEQNDNYLRNLQWRESIAEAQRLGISNPNDYHLYLFGRPSDKLPPPSPNARELVSKKLDEFKSKSIRTEQGNIYQDIRGSLGKTGMDSEEKAFLYSQIEGQMRQLAALGGLEGMPVPQYSDGNWRLEGKKMNDQDISAWLTRAMAGIAKLPPINARPPAGVKPPSTPYGTP